jgi:hypothetical protein
LDFGAKLNEQRRIDWKFKAKRTSLHLSGDQGPSKNHRLRTLGFQLCFTGDTLAISPKFSSFVIRPFGFRILLFSLQPERSLKPANPHNRVKLAKHPIFTKCYIFTAGRSDHSLHRRSAIFSSLHCGPPLAVLDGRSHVAKSIPSRSTRAKKSSPARGVGKKATPTKSAVGGKVVTVDRRERAEKGGSAEKGDRRARVERRKQSESVAVERRTLERREKVNRRRQIDPTTCEREYSDAEVEFMSALELYKRKNGRMFPTCSEILEVIVGLGYRKANEIEALPEENAAAQTLASDNTAE